MLICSCFLCVTLPLLSTLSTVIQGIDLGCYPAATGWPQSCTLQLSIPSIVEANFSEPALIQCRTTCETEISCLPNLRLYIPNGGFVIALTLGENSITSSDTETLFSYEIVTGIEDESNGTLNSTCIALAEFLILPKSYNLHESLAMCGVSCPSNSSNISAIYFFEAAFVIKLQSPQPTTIIYPTIIPLGAQLSPAIIAPVVTILFSIIVALLVLLLVVLFLYMRSRKKLAPFIQGMSLDKLTSVPLMQAMEGVNQTGASDAQVDDSDSERELMIRQEMARVESDEKASTAEGGIDNKLPDFISSRKQK